MRGSSQRNHLGMHVIDRIADLNRLELSSIAFSASENEDVRLMFTGGPNEADVLLELYGATYFMVLKEPADVGPYFVGEVSVTEFDPLTTFPGKTSFAELPVWKLHLEGGITIQAYFSALSLLVEFPTDSNR